MPGLCICNSAFDPFSGHLIALQVSAYLLQQTTSSASLGGKFSGQLRGICSDGDGQGLRPLLGPALPGIELAWGNPGTAGLRPGAVLRFQPRLGQVHHQHHISESCSFALAWKSTFQCK